MNPSPVFTGCAAALVTPFLPDGSIDQPALRRLISIQIDAHADAIVLLGKYAFRLLNDYVEQKRNGIKNPVFKKEKMKDIEQDIECW